MESDYNVVSHSWDGKPKTVWSYNKQQKLLNVFLEKYPDPISLKKKLLNVENPQCKVLAKYIDDNWSRNEYIDFVLTYIIKYSKVGKILLSQLIGTGIGSLIGYGINKHMNPSREDFKAQMKDKYHEAMNLKTDEEQMTALDSINDEIEKYNLNQTKIWRHTVPYATAIGTKGLASYGTYKLLDAIDKKRAKKNA